MSLVFLSSPIGALITNLAKRFSGPLVRRVSEGGDVLPCAVTEFRVLSAYVDLGHLAIECGLDGGFVFRPEKLFSLGLALGAQTLPDPCIAILAVEGALSPIGSAVKAVFVLHGLCSPGYAENYPDNRYRAVAEYWPPCACPLKNCGFPSEKGHFQGHLPQKRPFWRHAKNTIPCIYQGLRAIEGHGGGGGIDSGLPHPFGAVLRTV